ncbi:MAG: hypothetical protein GF364_02230 [Candidatus Lokiarchaeota archaeon]|nr:hypothetical protein [Candidatus Lokiarchaeota archaeon]
MYRTMELYEGIQTSKVVFAGLDKAGKSSIILALQKELSQLDALKPTRMAERKIFNFLGKKIASWDLGGQERYRASYLEDPLKYFEETKVFIYVVDVQDKQRYNESTTYFADIIKIMQKHEISPETYLFIHKFDPDYKTQLQKEDEDHINDLATKFKENNPSNSKLIIYQTSIYKPFSITTAFTKIVNKIHPSEKDS